MLIVELAQAQVLAGLVGFVGLELDAGAAFEGDVLTDAVVAFGVLGVAVSIREQLEATVEPGFVAFAIAMSHSKID